MQNNSFRVLAAILAIAAILIPLFVWSGGDDPPALSAERASPGDAPAITEVPDADLVSPGERPGEVQPAPERAAVAQDVQPRKEPDKFPFAVLGRFVNLEELPLEGVQVELQYLGDETTSGQDGRFRMDLELDDWRRGNELELVARLAGHERGSARIQFKGDEQNLGDIVLGPEGSLSGRVVDEDGAGFMGAEVLVTSLNTVGIGARTARPSNVLSLATTDSDGRFRVAGLAGGDVRVWAGAAEMLWAYTDAVLVRAGEETRDLSLRVVPIPDDGVIDLIVLDPAGNPVPRAPISYRYETSGFSGTGSATTDEQGRYRRVLEITAPFDFSARDPEDRYRPAVARSVQPGASNVVLQLGERRDLAVRVRDLKGGLVPNFSVSVRTLEGDQQLSGQNKTAGSDEVETGILVIQLPPETFEFSVRAEGHQVASLGPYEPDIVGDSIDVALVPLPGVRGRVVDLAGEPCAGATVGIHRGIGDNGTLTVNGFQCRSQKGADASGKTDDDGYFSITLRESGRFFLRASKVGYAADEIGPMELSSDTGSQGIELVLGGGGSIEGRVILPPDQSTAGLIVGVSRGDGFGITGTTDAKGKYRFDGLTPGRWLVQRRKEEISNNYTTSSSGDSDGGQEIPWNCEVWEDRTTHFDLDLSLAARVVVEGRFVLSDDPQVGWTVSLVKLEPAQQTLGEEHTDSQGGFRFELPDPGRHRLQFTGRLEDVFLFVMQEFELELGVNPIELSIPFGRIEGTVQPGALGEGEQIQFTFTGPDGLLASYGVRPDANGAFASPAPAGAVSLHVADSDEKVVQVEPGATAHVEFP